MDAQAGSDRMARLVRHLLQQRCFYPMSPSSTAVNLDYGHFAKALSFPVLPDLLLLPSQLKYFAKVRLSLPAFPHSCFVFCIHACMS